MEKSLHMKWVQMEEDKKTKKLEWEQYLGLLKQEEKELD